MTYNKAWRGIQIAKEILYENMEKSYNLVDALRVARNLGSYIAFNLEEEDQAFQKFFVGFKASIESFKLRCRPFIGLDGCHLRSKYLKILLSATALNGNNGLFPIAFAIVEGDS